MKDLLRSFKFVFDFAFVNYFNLRKNKTATNSSINERLGGGGRRVMTTLDTTASLRPSLKVKLISML